ILAPLAGILLCAASLTWLSRATDRSDAEFQAARKKADERAARASDLARNSMPPAGPLATLSADPHTPGPHLLDPHCASCHPLAPTPHPGTAKTYHQGVKPANLDAHMPAFADELDSAEIDLLARWIHETAPTATSKP